MSNMQDFVALTSILNKRIACLFYKQCCASVINHENAIAKKKKIIVAYQYVMWPEYLEQNTKRLCGVTILVQTFLLHEQQGGFVCLRAFCTKKG